MKSLLFLVLLLIKTILTSKSEEKTKTETKKKGSLPSDYFVITSMQTYKKMEGMVLEQKFGSAVTRLNSNKNVVVKDVDGLVQAQFASRLPNVFAETFDWTKTYTKEECSILGDTSMIIQDALAYDNGTWKEPTVKKIPEYITLGFVSGALRIPGYPDSTENIAELYARRLVPVFAAFSALMSGSDPKGRGLVTMPAIGCGAFRGTLTLEEATQEFVAILRDILDTYKASHFPNLDFWLGLNQAMEIKNITEDAKRGLLIEITTLGQLEASSAYCHGIFDSSLWSRRFSVAASDPFSWPGNDWLSGSRWTDDGVKGAATNILKILTGYDGEYSTKVNGYVPSPVKTFLKTEVFPTWSQLIKRLKLIIKTQERVYVYDPAKPYCFSHVQ